MQRHRSLWIPSFAVPIVFLNAFLVNVLLSTTLLPKYGYVGASMSKVATEGFLIAMVLWKGAEVARAQLRRSLSPAC